MASCSVQSLEVKPPSILFKGKRDSERLKYFKTMFTIIQNPKLEHGNHLIDFWCAGWCRYISRFPCPPLQGGHFPQVLLFKKLSDFGVKSIWHLGAYCCFWVTRKISFLPSLLQGVWESLPIFKKEPCSSQDCPRLFSPKGSLPGAAKSCFHLSWKRRNLSLPAERYTAQTQHSWSKAHCFALFNHSVR